MNMQRKIKLCRRGTSNNRVLPERVLPEKLSGFTLIEIMITVVIIGILASIALPSYTNYVIKANRSEGKAALVDAATRQEQFFLDNKTYTADMTDLGLDNNPYITESKTYSVTAAASPGKTIATSYTLTAEPIGNVQSKDTQCDDLTLASNGTKGATGTSSASDCW